MNLPKTDSLRVRGEHILYAHLAQVFHLFQSACINQHFDSTRTRHSHRRILQAIVDSATSQRCSIQMQN